MLIEGAGSHMSHNQLSITTAAISNSDTASRARDLAAKWQICIPKVDYMYTNIDVHTAPAHRTQQKTLPWMQVTNIYLKLETF